MRKKNIYSILKIFLLFVTFITFSLVNKSLADPVELIIKKGETYDIYFSSADDESAIIKGVNIIRVVNIEENSFLEVTSDKRRSINTKKGFIRMNRISAILPSGKITTLNKSIKQ